MSDLATQESNESEVIDSVNNEPELTMAETMADKLAEIRGRSAEKQDDAPDETEQQKAARVRDDKGKFAKADDGTKVVPVVAPDPANTTTTQTTEPVIQATRVQPPNGFTAAGKEEFAKASPAMQQEVLKREGDFHKYYQQTQKDMEPIKQSAAFGQSIAQAIQPFEQTLRTLGASPAQAIQGLFAADHKLRYGAPQEKLQAFAELAKGYGIDLSQGLPTQQQFDPNVEYLQRQNQQAMSVAQQAQQEINRMKQEFAQQAQQAENNQLNSLIDQAKQGKPHFDDLRQEIGMILQSSINRANQTGSEVMTLDQAYEAALWQSPQHRVELLAKQQADADAAAAQKRAEDAEKAKLARKASSVNVQRRGTMPAQAPVGDVKDMMRDKLAEIRSR